MKLLLLMRGISGSGKSTEARKWLKRGLSPIITSADEFLTGSFDFRQLSDAHSRCYMKFQDAMVRNHDLIIVDNTNTTIEEMAKYRRPALEKGYEVVVLQINADPILAYNQCTHQVPLGTIEHQARRIWSERIPKDWDVWMRGPIWKPRHSSGLRPIAVEPLNTEPKEPVIEYRKPPVKE